MCVGRAFSGALFPCRSSAIISTSGSELLRHGAYSGNGSSHLTGRGCFMTARLNRIKKLTTQREFELVSEVLSKALKELHEKALKRRITQLRKYFDKARARAIAEARKGKVGELSRRKAEIFRETLQRCESRLLELEVKTARELQKASAQAALKQKQRAAKAKRPGPGRTAGKGMASKPRGKPLSRLTAGREKGRLLGTQRRSQARRDKK